jgi:predicted nuclease with TOPRIM domain
LRGLDLEDHEQTAEEIGNMRKEMERLKERNELLEYRMRKIQKEEQNLSKKVDLDDKLALKKLVVMLKMKNDQMKNNVGSHRYRMKSSNK